MTKKQELFRIITLVLAFFLINFDPALAQIYFFVLFADFVWFTFDISPLKYPIERTKTNRAESFIFAVLMFGAFIIISSIIPGFISSMIPALNIEPTVGLQSVFELLSSTTPILKGSIILTVIGWGGLVPSVETPFFFGRLLEGLVTYSKTFFGRQINVDKLDFFNKEQVMLIFFIAGIFTLFHITAKGIHNNAALMVTFIFGIFQCAMVIRDKETKSAWLLHIFVNTAAIMWVLKIFTFM